MTVGGWTTPARLARAATACCAVVIGFVTVYPSVASASASGSAAQAKKSLLLASDLPVGWTTSPSSSNNSFPLAHAKTMASCIGLPVSVLTDNSPSASSPEFDSMNQALSVDDQVTVYRSAQVAKAQLASIESKRTPACFATLMNDTDKSSMASSIGKGTKIGKIVVTRDHANYGPGTAGLIMKIPVSTSSDALTVKSELVFAVKGHESQQLTFTAAPGTFPTTLAQQLAKTAVARLP
jgi:hypothetical protein